jgi:cephalosporin hydroxylase
MKVQQDVAHFNDHIIENAIGLFSQCSALILDDDELPTVIEKLSQFAPVKKIKPVISQMIHWHLGRFVDFESRYSLSKQEADGADLPIIMESHDRSAMVESQGKFECFQWKDYLLFKSTYDMCLHQMLMWELKPKTIIEIGSGSGGSAVWMADMMKVYDLKTHIYSFDIVAPKLSYENVTFIQGDHNNIKQGLKLLKDLPHPWLVIENAHFNFEEGLMHLDEGMLEGDYMVVVDSDYKQDEVLNFIKTVTGKYLVDTKYCDFFGQNMTCSFNSILKKMF